MQQCNQVEKNHEQSKQKAEDFAALYDRNSEPNDGHNVQSDAVSQSAEEDENNRGLLAGNPLSLFSGVFPGTKWCGTGDIAKNFHDLGTVRACYINKILN